jgi:hypothetical protein
VLKLLRAVAVGLEDQERERNDQALKKAKQAAEKLQQRQDLADGTLTVSSSVFDC